MRISLGGKGPGQESKPMLSPLLLMSTNPPLTSSAGTRPARVPPSLCHPQQSHMAGGRVERRNPWCCACTAQQCPKQGLVLPLLLPHTNHSPTRLLGQNKPHHSHTQGAFCIKFLLNRDEGELKKAMINFSTVISRWGAQESPLTSCKNLLLNTFRFFRATRVVSKISNSQ